MDLAKCRKVSVRYLISQLNLIQFVFVIQEKEASNIRFLKMKKKNMFLKNSTAWEQKQHKKRKERDWDCFWLAELLPPTRQPFTLKTINPKAQVLF